MKVFIVVVGIICIGVALWFFGPRIIKTVFLVAQTSPYKQQVADAPTILVLGDSTGYGTGVRDSAESVAGRMGSDFPQYSIKNNSVNGRTIAELLPVVQGLSGQYALILLQIGGNDILQKRDVAAAEAELRQIITKLQTHTNQIAMISTGNVGGSYAFQGKIAQEYEALSRSYRDMFITVGSETQLTYVDVFAEPEVDPFILEPQLYLSIDGLHPSAAGYELWYAELQPVLKAKLQRQVL